MLHPYKRASWKCEWIGKEKSKRSEWGGHFSRQTATRSFHFVRPCGQDWDASDCLLYRLDHSKERSKRYVAGPRLVQGPLVASADASSEMSTGSAFRLSFWPFARARVSFLPALHSSPRTHTRIASHRFTSPRGSRSQTTDTGNAVTDTVSLLLLGRVTTALQAFPSQLPHC